MAGDVLERFHQALVQEIQTQCPAYLLNPFTVAEIYQNLVPYRSHRDRIGVEINGDYEFALIRLLAGEGGYLLIDSEHALRDLRAELESQNPNTGLYREFAAVDVRLNEKSLGLSAAAAAKLSDSVKEPVAEKRPKKPKNKRKPKASSRSPLAAELVDAGVANGSAGETEAMTYEVPATPVGDRACQWCQANLPAREKLNFCPFCGTDLTLHPCATCGEEIEPNWSFCASCGATVDADRAGD